MCLCSYSCPGSPAELCVCVRACVCASVHFTSSTHLMRGKCHVCMYVAKVKTAIPL